MARMKVGGSMGKQVGESSESHLCVCQGQHGRRSTGAPTSFLSGGGLVVGGWWVPASDDWRQAVIVQCGTDPPRYQAWCGTNSHAQLMDDDAMYLAFSGGGRDVVAQSRQRT
jgi:hypothetical protein